MKTSKSQGLFFIWKGYQRRPEILADLINSRPKFIPHLFKQKYLRPFDYLIKFFVSIKEILQAKPDFIIAQCPPTYSVIPALITGVPYIIDGHNPLFQVPMWQKLPLSKYLMKRAQAIIVHNGEILNLVKDLYPSIPLFTISDPIEFISADCDRNFADNQILVIASFDPWDEPVELLLEVMKKLTDYKFIVTADTSKLPTEIAQNLEQMDNVCLTGFLPVKEYHEVLCSSLAALVLTTSAATQPSGACEALSSDTQLVLSKTSLTAKLFGEWANLVDNSPESIITAIRALPRQKIDLSEYRNAWNISVRENIDRLSKFIDNKISH
jgi:hypothetical protein